MTLFFAVADAAEPLVGVGGPMPAEPTVTTVESVGDVTRPDAVSVALIVAVTPVIAPATTVASPSALTVTATVFEDWKVSSEASRITVDPSL